MEVSFQPGYMTNMMILTFTLSTFPFLSSNIPSGPSYVADTFCSSYDMQDAAHITMILDIARSAWLIDFCHKATLPCGLRSRLRNFMADIKVSLRNTKGQTRR